METIILTALLGFIIGTVDVIPMIKMKLDRYSIGSAFIFYTILPFMIFNIDLYGIVWWLKGGFVAFLLALPTIILVAKEDKKSIPPMLIMSIVLGTMLGTIQHIWL